MKKAKNSTHKLYFISILKSNQSKILFQVDQTVLGTESEKQEPVSTPEQIKPQ